ncbi:hypothetical protein ONE63_011282 [Megalurothrips usitatus]|uniref:HEPN domain-containing protein n=1 Tax=Megalurothrips usitatus TaxID=439358 RepID=A0AAV7WZJ3_9NEOP|nr:hypothetical protein ONE63_011282 [Megalurothrips usitatus]
MWKDNEQLSWKSIELLFEVTKSEKFRTHKLTRAHVHLTSYGCMKVILAAQVMSKSVADSLIRSKDDHRFKGHDLTQLIKFLELMNDAFDCRNSHGGASGKRNKSNLLLAPYTRSNHNKEAKEKMFISQQSYESLKMAVYGFEGAVKYLIEEKHAPSINGRKFNQDKLEQYFGVIRMSGGGSDNPTLQRLLQKNVSLHIQGQAARPTKRGNTEVNEEWIPDQAPILKRRRAEEK